MTPAMAALIAAVKEQAKGLAEPLEEGDEGCGAACAYAEAAVWAAIVGRLLDGKSIDEAFGEGWNAEFGVGEALIPFHDAPVNVKLNLAAPAMLDALLFVKAWFQKLEDDTDDDDPLKAIRRVVHAPIHAAIDPAIEAAR